VALHEPVLTQEVLTFLEPQRGGLFVDCTVGAGGHSLALLEAGAARLIGLDRDPAALTIAAETLKAFRDRADLVHADFRQLDAVLDARGVGAINGALADLGMSSMQLAEPGRGFSFQRDELLDMRMDTTASRTAADIPPQALM
jgi:16S rRNA (cytosine1402-N4)-methyltransferase